MAGKKSLTGSIALTKIKHIKMTCNGKSGKVEGIFIPIQANKLVVGKPDSEGNTPVYLNISIPLREEPDTYGNSGMINKSIDIKSLYGKTYSQLTDEQKAEVNDLTPILGNVKLWEAGGNSADSSGNAGTKEEYAPEDDLPF